MSLIARLALIATIVAAIVSAFVVLEHDRSDDMEEALAELLGSQRQVALVIQIEGLIHREANALAGGSYESVGELAADTRRLLAELTEISRNEHTEAEVALIGQLVALQDQFELTHEEFTPTAMRNMEHILQAIVQRLLDAEHSQIAEAGQLLEHETTITMIAASMAIALLVIAIVLGVVIPLRRYLARVIGTTRRIAGGDLSTPVDIQGPRDLSALGQAVEAMRVRLDETLGIEQRMAELERFDAALRDSEQRYRTLFDHSPLPMLNYDPAARQIRNVNDALVALHGSSREELLALQLADLFIQDDVEPLCRDAHSLGIRRMRRRDGQHVELDITSHAIVVGGHTHMLAVCVDVTEARKVEAQLRQAQKLEAIGQLAGGVAHDFNNILAVVQMNAELLADDLGVGHPATGDISEISVAAERGARLTRQLLAFSRKQHLSPKPLALNASVTELNKMLDRIVGEDIEIATVLSSRTGVVHADSGQLEQVVMNLVVNARDAMPTGGRITIETSSVELDYHRAAQLSVSSGRYAMLSVRDTGCGMDDLTRARIFEPFFTTKPVGKGTGLGLANVFGIVAQSKGAIEVDSKVGAGTTFRIYLPRVADDLDAQQTAEPTVVTNDGSATILIVEDEDQVRSVIKRMLASWGYRCLEARTPDSALDLVRHSRERIDLLLTDLVMPGMSGRALAAQIRLLRPEIKVVVMSGYTEHPSVTIAAAPDEQFVAKPFSATSLSTVLRDSFGEPPRRDSQSRLRAV
jgi:two-component system, cell cycle sensor histidine kinase and response regulator CckA